MNENLFYISLKGCTPLNSFTLVHRGKRFPVNPTILGALSSKIYNLIQNSIFTYELPCLPGPVDDFLSIIFGENVLINAGNCRFLNYLANDLEIPILVSTTEEVILECDFFNDVIEFATLLVENDLNADKYLQKIIYNLEKIDKEFFPLEKMPPKLIAALFKAPKFPLSDNTYLMKLIKAIEKDPFRNRWLIKCINFRIIDCRTLTKILCSPVIDLNEIRTELVGYGTELNFRNEEDQIDTDEKKIEANDK